MTDFVSSANALYGVLLVIAGGVLAFLVKARGEWAKSKTNAVMEAAQQAGIASMVEALAASGARERMAGEREQEAWAMVRSSREERDSLSREIGGYREEVAQLRTMEENCRREVADLRESQAASDREHEGVRRTLNNAVKQLEARLHDMSNRLVGKGGTLTGTDIFPREAP